jgi:hypothetical protein
MTIELTKQQLDYIMWALGLATARAESLHPDHAAAVVEVVRALMEQAKDGE